MSKLDDILDEFAAEAVTNTQVPRTLVRQPAKEKIQKIFTELIEESKKSSMPLTWLEKKVGEL